MTEAGISLNTTAQHVRIDLRGPPGFKLVELLSLPIVLAMAIVCLLILWEALLCMFGSGLICAELKLVPVIGVNGSAGVLLIGSILCCTALVSLLLRLCRPTGWVEIGPTHIALACYSLGPISGVQGGYFCAGFSAWENLQKVDVTRAQGLKCVGVRFSDVSEFLDGRTLINDQNALRAAAWGEKWNRISLGAVLLLPMLGSFLDLMMRLLGYSGLPKSSEEIDILDWNCKNWGYHLLVPRWLIPNYSNVVELIRRHQIMPGPVQTSHLVESRSVETRLRELNDLLSKGLVNNDEYDQKRKEILSEL
jgi:hypothetical protein